MKIAVMSTYDNEGGAARCAHRLHRGLIQQGIDSTYFVQKKFGADADVITFHRRPIAELRPGIDRIPLRIYRNRRRAPFSTGLVSPLDTRSVVAIHPDLVNLHYIGEGFLPIRALGKISRPIVWTLHDSWPFTGGCHLPGDCTSYQDMCGNCPLLASGSSADLSRWIMRRKSSQWQHLDIVVVAGSRWLAECARTSSLFSKRRIEVIHPGLNLKAYLPVERATARSILSLPQDKRLILFGAIESTTDPNKGFHLLHPAVKHLSQLKERAFEVVVFGANEPSPAADFGVPSHYMGRLHDDVSLAILYAAADVMVVPSLSESFGQTASEAMACGTPVVAFAATGLLDIVTHQHNGYLAEPYDHLDLARGIDWVLSREWSEARALSENARTTAVSRFSIEAMAAKYIDLFEDVLRHQASAGP